MHFAACETVQLTGFKLKQHLKIKRWSGLSQMHKKSKHGLKLSILSEISKETFANIFAHDICVYFHLLILQSLHMRKEPPFKRSFETQNQK